MPQLPVYEPSTTFQPVQPVTAANSFEALSAVAGEVEKFGEVKLAQAKNLALEDNKSQMTVGVMKQNQKLLNQAQQEPNLQNGLKSYQTQYQAYASELMKQVPEENKAFVGKLLFATGQQGQKQFQQKIAQQGKLEALTQIKEQTETYLNEIQNNASDPDKQSQQISEALVGQYHRYIKSQVEAGTLHAGDGSTYLTKAQDSYKMGRLAAEYQLAKQEDPENGAAKFRKKLLKSDVFKGFNQDKAFAKLKEMDRNQDAVNRTSDEQRNQLKTELLYQAHNTGQVNPSEFNAARQAFMGRFGDVENQINRAEVIGSQVNALKYADVNVMQARIDELNEPLTKEDLLKPGISQTQEDRQMESKLLTSNKKALLSDSAAYVETSPALKAILQKINKNMVNVPKNDPNYQEQVSNYHHAYRDAVVNFQKQMGLKDDVTKPLRNDEVAAHIAQIDTTPGYINKLNLVSALQQSVGPNHSDKALQQLRNGGVGFAVPGLHKIIGTKFQQYLPVFVNAMDKGNKELMAEMQVKPGGESATIDNINSRLDTKLSSFRDTLINTGGDAGKAYGEVRDTLTTLVLGMLASGKSKSIDDAVQKVGDSVIDQHYQYASSGTGNTIRYPNTLRIGKANQRFDTDLAERANTALKNDIIKNPPNNLEIPLYFRQKFSQLTPKQQRQSYVEMMLTNARVVNNGTDDGAQMTDGWGVPLRLVDNKGRPTGTIGYKWNDLYKTGSDINKQALEISKTRLKVGEALKLEGRMLLSAITAGIVS